LGQETHVDDVDVGKAKLEARCLMRKVRRGERGGWGGEKKRVTREVIFVGARFLLR
jgi:hypothetical protein